MNGLLVDFGGVLTTNVFASFRAFCADEGIDPERITTARCRGSRSCSA
jgi:hypothetical protein